MDPSQKMWSKLLGVVLFVAYIRSAVSDGVLGCGGFVKSDVEINFSLVEMKLYTVQGSIKYQTDCAPNNGYYLIPLYDKGDFILQVEPPPGWSFEPELVRLHIDGSTDKCSLGEDINFQFKGFSIQGMVLSKGQKKGPGGVRLSLMAAGSNEVLQTTTSVENEDYYFKKVMPGDYIIMAHHDTWKFERPTASVTVTLDNGVVTDDIIVAGYDVSGRVFSEGEPIKGVNFLLYSDSVKPQDITLCDTSPVKGLKTVDASICHVSSQENGIFTFPSLPPGEYYLIPFYKGEHITFDVVPEKITFQVDHNSINLPNEFQVAGFSVSGLVVDSVKGNGIAGAKIFISGKQMAVSDSDGSYHLENMKTGKYNIQVVSDKIFFEEVSLKITPNTPQLPDIVASRFSVCGKVFIDEVPKGLDRTALQRKVNVFTEEHTVKVMILDTDIQGEFCAPFKPGKYVFQVVLTPQELKAGLYLSPEAQLVTVTNKPVLDVTFTQFRAKLSGFISCIENCGTLGLSLDPIGMIGEDKKVIMLKDAPKKASFEFENILPGKYKVTPLQDNWCWKEKSKEVEITDKDVMGLEFTQTGYILKCGLSHEITLNFAHENKQGSVGSFALKKGTNRFCLSQPGVYRLTTDSCHRFEKDVYTYDTSNPVVLSLTAVKHKVTGVINTEVPAENLLVSIKSPLMKTPITLEPTAEMKAVDSSKDSQETVDPEPVAKSLKYYFSYWAKSNERLEIKVLSEELLFSPNQVDVTVHGESCPGELAHFTGKVGIFITGKVEPPLSGVQVTVSSPDNAVMEPVTLETDDTGVYRLGPLHSDKQYSVEAVKVGFVLTKDPDNPMNFKALKLGEIAVQIIDESEQSLSNVLLSLSGDRQYRSNNLTKDGAMVFSSLSPGQYFLRPMMKEYRFEPASQMITVLEGTTMSLTIKGFREAYSCYGRVSSLNGEPEPGVVVEAVSVSGDVKYQEESKTEQDGTYRIRGLQPSVTYQIQIKKVENSHLERSAPKFRLLKVENADLTNVNIIAFRRMNQMDVSGNVVTPPDILPTLKVVLYKEDSPDSPTHSISLGTTSFFYLPSLPTDDQEYNLRLESSLSYSKYNYILPEYSFVANTAYKHVTFKFEPKRLVDQEFNQSSFLSLPLALLLLGAAYTLYKYKNNYGKRRMVDQDLLSFLMLPFAMLVTGYKYISNIFRNNYGKIVPLNTRDVFSQPASDSGNQSIPESLRPDTGSGKRKIKVRKT